VVVASLRKDPNQRISSVGLLAERLRPWAPRWALEAAVRATRIAGGGSAAIEDSGIFPPLAVLAPAPARARVSLPVAESPQDLDPSPRDATPRDATPRPPSPTVRLPGAAARPLSPRWRPTRLAIGGGALLLGAALLACWALLARSRPPSPVSGPAEALAPIPVSAPEGSQDPVRAPASPASPAPRSGATSPPSDLPAGAPPAELPVVAAGAHERDTDRAQAVRRAGAAGPKHPGPVSFESVIHMGPRSANGTPKREVVRSGAPANWSPPSSDPLDSRR
jgi:hypothetical protein